MKRNFLEDLGLEKEVVDKIMAENGKDIENAKANYDELKAELKTANATIADRDNQLKELKDSAKGNEDLTAKIAELEKQNKDEAKNHKAEIESLKINNAIDNFKGTVPGYGADDVNPETDKMTYSQMCAYLEDNPGATI